MTFVFVHVPKCGGTTLLKKIETSSMSSYIDYDAYIGLGMHRRNEEAKKIDFTVFDIIYGHFPIGRYKGSNKYQYIALVRDPLSRCISQYLHTKWRWENGQLPNDHFGRRMAAGSLSFIDYSVERPYILHAYRHFLGYWKASEFTLIGQVERYTDFVNAFSDLTGVQFLNDKKDRAANEILELSAVEINEANRLLVDEYSWYREFIKKSV
jgi:hypothetical protein